MIRLRPSVFRVACVAAFLAAAAAWGAEPPTVAYKGRALTGSADPRANAAFYEIVKKAIDMAEQLPPRQKALAARIPDLRYDPSLNDAPTVVDSLVGTYVFGRSINDRGSIVFRLNPAMSSPLDYLLAIVANATYDVWRVRLIDAGAVNDAEKIDYYRRLLSRQDPDANILAGCVQLADMLAVYDAVDADPRKTDKLSKETTDRGCHERKAPY
jgi:hypothetical protein